MLWHFQLQKYVLTGQVSIPRCIFMWTLAQRNIFIASCLFQFSRRRGAGTLSQRTSRRQTETSSCTANGSSGQGGHGDGDLQPKPADATKAWVRSFSKIVFQLLHQVVQGFQVGGQGRSELAHVPQVHYRIQAEFPGSLKFSKLFRIARHLKSWKSWWGKIPRGWPSRNMARLFANQLFYKLQQVSQCDQWRCSRLF